MSDISLQARDFGSQSQMVANYVSPKMWCPHVFLRLEVLEFKIGFLLIILKT
jgi:hypothetical protein